MTTTSSYANKQTSKNSNKEEREFSLNIRVRCVQDEIPAGLNRILNMLEEAMLTKRIPLDEA